MDLVRVDDADRGGVSAVYCPVNVEPSEVDVTADGARVEDVAIDVDLHQARGGDLVEALRGSRSGGQREQARGRAAVTDHSDQLIDL